MSEEGRIGTPASLSLSQLAAPESARSGPHLRYNFAVLGSHRTTPCDLGGGLYGRTECGAREGESPGGERG